MYKINGADLKAMLESGCNNLNNRQEEINALNVFPVPDGDTGTNMSLTATNGINEVLKSGSDSLPTIAKTFSRGLLMGARGNSGVILSQIFRGFSSYVTDKESLTVQELAAAMMSGAKQAYKAVMRPVEGTILTVVREASEYTEIYVSQNSECTIEDVIDVLCKEAKASLDRTPELLPVLKEARVVDSGGAGLLTVFEGFRSFLMGNPILPMTEEEKAALEHARTSGYCVEFILKLSDRGSHLYKEEKLRSALTKIGENITLITDGLLVKVRMNTMSPGEILNQGQRFGEFEAIQIDNLAIGQRPSILDAPTEEKEFGIIAVAAGEGLEKLFEEYRADIVVSGGQTMNPSTESFVSAIKKLNAKHIFILPNNSNIIMAAKQAAEVIDDKDVYVFETKSIPQGLSACITFNSEETVEANIESMNAAIANVKTGQITYSIKDTVIDGREIHAGDYMGIYEKEICLTNIDKVQASCELISKMCDEDSAILTLLQGADATDEECMLVQKYVEEHFDIDIDVRKGNQPVYSFIIGVE